MAAYDLEEQEQLSAIKAWWASYGNFIAGALAAVAVGVLAWQGWNYHVRQQAAAASTLYGQLVLAVENQDRKTISELSGKLITDFGSTSQAQLGALLAAKADLEANEAKAAKPRLEYVVNTTDDAMLRDLARLRLAALLIDEKSYDAALTLLERTPVDSYASRFADMRGDVLAAKGDKEQARGAYRDALERAQQSGSTAAFRDIVETKLEALGGA